MKKRITIAASLACANYKHLEQDIRELEQAGVDAIHFDGWMDTLCPTFL